MISALTEVFKEATDATKRKVCIIELQLISASKQVSAQIKIELHAANLCVRAEPERDDSEVLQNIATG